MMYVCGGIKPAHDDMFGLYASRRYEHEEAITVYVGKDIGAVDGTIDDYKGYYHMQQLQQHDSTGRSARHVMAIGGRLIDGTDGGYTGAQYANAAYRVDHKWHNNAEIKDGGTVRVMKNKIINAGDEILFAYHAGLWVLEQMGRGAT